MHNSQLPDSRAANICTWIYRDSEGDESSYPQVIGNSSSKKFLAPYWRCVVIYFASSLRNNPNANHVLFTNLEHLPTIGDFSIQDFFDQNKIQVVKLPLSYQAPKGYFGAWRNQFYIFDIVNYITNYRSRDERYLILDSDCVWVKSVESILNDLDRYGLLTYDLKLPEDWNMNGLTRQQMQQIFGELSQAPVAEVPHYFGGEWFGATGHEIARLAAEVDAVWKESIRRFEQGLPKFNEEAHVLSYLYYRLGYASGTANPYIKQIWTTRRYYNADRSNFDLSVWHVPAEKLYGFKRLFDQVCNPASDFWTLPLGEPFAQYLAEYLGIPRRTSAKLLLDAYDFGKVSLQKRLSRVM